MFAKKKDGWFKPYVLNQHNIEKFVSEGRPGVYILGNVQPDEKVKVQQIRTSLDVKSELKKNLGRFHVFMYKPMVKRVSVYNQNQGNLQMA